MAVKSIFIYCKKCEKKVKHWDNRGTDKEKQFGTLVCADCKNAVKDKDKATGTGSGKKEIYTGNGVPASMYGRWVTDITVAFIAKGVVKTPEDAIAVATKIAAGYSKLLSDGKPQPVAVEEESVDTGLDADLDIGTGEPDPEAVKELDDDFNVDNLDI